MKLRGLGSVWAVSTVNRQYIATADVGVWRVKQVKKKITLKDGGGDRTVLSRVLLS